MEPSNFVLICGSDGVAIYLKNVFYQTSNHKRSRNHQTNSPGYLVGGLFAYIRKGADQFYAE